ncbi:MAG: aspartate-semialdehyde dehydrogenase [Planctomycetota bacterium]|jgi:aspartate-semialdehyde dehydrogenase
MNNPPVVAIAGVTGAVGQEFLELIEERRFPFSELKLLASKRSAGKQITLMGKTYTVEELTADSFDGVDIALFSAGGSISREFGPIAASKGCVVVDNSSAFRMDPETPLVVPEVNPEAIAEHKGIIANPNCSTIIMNVPVWPLHQAAGVKRVVVSTYQAASGAGAAAMAELEQQAKDWANNDPITQDIFGRQYIWNLFSHNSNIDPDNGYNEEEIKMVKETKKIFGAPDIAVAATCIRVPVLRAHCESVNITLENPLSLYEVNELLANAPGVTIIDDRESNSHPEPLLASGKDDVMVGRVRADLSQPEGYGYEMFIAGDQIRKGAALNAVQIAELLLEKVTA